MVSEDVLKCKNVTFAEEMLDVKLSDLDKDLTSYLDFRDDAIDTLQGIYYTLSKRFYNFPMYSRNVDDDNEAAQTLAIVSFALSGLYKDYLDDEREDIAKLRTTIDAHYANKK